MGLPHAAVREQVTSAIDLVVQQARLADGGRAVESVTQVMRANDGSQVWELYRRGGPLEAPTEGRLAERIAMLRREGAG